MNQRLGFFTVELSTGLRTFSVGNLGCSVKKLFRGRKKAPQAAGLVSGSCCGPLSEAQVTVTHSFVRGDPGTQQLVQQTGLRLGQVLVMGMHISARLRLHRKC